MISEHCSDQKSNIYIYFTVFNNRLNRKVLLAKFCLPFLNDFFRFKNLDNQSIDLIKSKKFILV